MTAYIPCPVCQKFPVVTRRMGGRSLVYHINRSTGCAYSHGADDDAHGAAEWAQHCRENAHAD